MRCTLIERYAMFTTHEFRPIFVDTEQIAIICHVAVNSSIDISFLSLHNSISFLHDQSGSLDKSEY